MKTSLQTHQKCHFCPLTIKVIIDKSRGELPLLEQDTIDYVSTAYFEPKKSKIKK
jgi:hypothetical protein